MPFITSLPLCFQSIHDRQFIRKLTLNKTLSYLPKGICCFGFVHFMSRTQMFVPISCIGDYHKGDWTPVSLKCCNLQTHSNFPKYTLRILPSYLPSYVNYCPTVNTNISTLLSRIDLDFVEVYETMNVF